jgi:hypothetical protein
MAQIARGLADGAAHRGRRGKGVQHDEVMDGAVVAWVVKRTPASASLRP